MYELMVASRVRGTMIDYHLQSVKVYSKRPTYITEETYTNDKRDLHMSNKRPICMNEWLNSSPAKGYKRVVSKETYTYDKRDLQI